MTTLAPSPAGAMLAQAETFSASVPLAISDQTLSFLRAVWGVFPSAALVGLVADVAYQRDQTWHSVMSPKWGWVEDILAGDTDLPDWAQEMNAKEYPIPGKGSLYWNAASRKTSVLHRYAARGSSAELGMIGSFYCDLDCLKHGYSLGQGMEVLLKMPLPPSIIVFTGGGLQAVHLLAEPWPLPNAASVHEYKDHSLALYKPAFQVAGLALDTSVHEATRELRLPGTRNRKPERHNAMARVLYWQPDRRYSMQEIKHAAPILPKTPRVFLPAKVPENGLYPVDQAFIHFLIDGNTPVERHPTLLSLSLQAARANISEQDFLARVRPFAQKWFAGAEGYRAESELDKLVNWSYSRVAENPDAYPAGEWLIKLTELGFEQASLDQQAKHTARTESIPNPAPLPPSFSVQAVRSEQTSLIQEYLAAKNRRDMGTFLLLRTSPGAGKSHAVVKALEQVAEAQKEQGLGSNAAFLSLFKFDERNWQRFVLGFQGNPDLWFYLVARNGDPQSAGYCALHTQAEAVGRKNYNIVQTLCARCPFHDRCKDSWYLSQFDRAKTAPILLARHQHGMIKELVQRRQVIAFDESPLDVVAGALDLKLADLVMQSAPVWVADQQQNELKTLQRWIAGIRAVIAGNTPIPAVVEGSPLKQYATQEHVKLGGRWFFEQLERQIGLEAMQAAATLDPQFLKEATYTALHDPSPESVAALPMNWTRETWRVFSYEFVHHFTKGKTNWNSRIIPWGDSLRVFPMQAFNFQQQTKVLITDATGLPELYGKALTYTKQAQGVQTLRPREALIYEARLDPLSKITQFIGTENSKSTLRRKVNAAAKDDPAPTKREKIHLSVQTDDDPFDPRIVEIDPQDFAEEPDSDVIAHTKDLIKHLAKLHAKSLLIISYKETINTSLMKWVKQYKILPPEQVQWFGNLRGKNDFKDLQAVLIIGTPRLPPMDVLALAQVWHWQDELPVDSAPLVRREAYAGYKDASGQGGIYPYLGYADERVNRIYIGMIQAEMRQCYERIRPNASFDAAGQVIPKHVYLASAFPCADHVDVLQHWSTWWVDFVGRRYSEKRLAEGCKVFQEDYTKHVIQETRCAYNTAKASFERIHAEFVATGQVQTGMKQKTKKQRIQEWLAVDPKRSQLSIRQIAEQSGFKTNSIQRALSELKR